MAVQALMNQFVSINAVVLSDHVKSAILPIEVDQLDSTAMGGTWKSFLGGLKAGSLQLLFNDDFVSGSVDSTLWGLLGTLVPFEVRADAAVVGVNNPKYTGSLLIAQHTLGGAVGSLAAKQLSFPTSGTVTRATS